MTGSGNLVVERAQGGGESNEGTLGHTLTHVEGPETHQGRRSMRWPATGCEDDEGDGKEMAFERR